MARSKCQLHSNCEVVRMVVERSFIDVPFLALRMNLWCISYRSIHNPLNIPLYQNRISHSEHKLLQDTQESTHPCSVYTSHIALIVPPPEGAQCPSGDPFNSIQGMDEDAI